jgi:Transposase
MGTAMERPDHTTSGADDPVFTALWTAHRRRMLDLAFRMLLDLGDAEDAVQEAFTRLARTDIAGIDELLGAWLAKESVRDVYLADTPADAVTLLDKAIVGCASDEVAEIRSLAKTLASWRTEILAHHDTGASNGPTEGLNLCVKKVKRSGHGFRSFDNYRLRVLLHAGGITWPERPHPPRIRTRSPHSDA